MAMDSANTMPENHVREQLTGRLGVAALGVEHAVDEQADADAGTERAHHGKAGADQLGSFWIHGRKLLLLQSFGESVVAPARRGD